MKIPDIQNYRRFLWLPDWAALGLVVLGILTGLATFLVLTGLTPIQPSEDVGRGLMQANVLLIVLMGLLVGYQLLRLLWELKQRTPGAGLHLRLISIFSLVAVVPAVMVAIFAAVVLNRGLDNWFSDRTRSIVNTASTVAEAYLDNASQATRSDLANIATDLSQQFPLFRDDRPAYLRRVARHAAVRNLAGVFVFDSATKRVEANVTANERIKFIAPDPTQLAAVEKGEVLVLPPGRGGGLVRALMRIPGYPSHYLYVYRVISPVVVEQVAKTREAKAEYDLLLSQRVGVQWTYASVFALLALVFLLAALWMGLRFSDRIVEPIVRLLNASLQVAQGDFGAKVRMVEGPGDLMTLSRTFNMMTDQIRMHRDQLVETNEQLDERRRFSEAMLAGVSAGVIGIDPSLHISVVNRSALYLLELNEHQVVGHLLGQVAPEFLELFAQAMARPSGFAEGQVEKNVNDLLATFFVRITVERADDAEHGFVVTFDDITSLVNAQRNSAWADIAQRIAHEIKNPLTPIQLSAERLKRKYLKEITSDPKVFEQCTDTIIRQVGDLGRIVDEFSSFARMPKAIPEPNDLRDTVHDATVLQRVSSADITIEIVDGPDMPRFAFDRRLVTQAITNLVKNARESVESRLAASVNPKGEVRIFTGMKGDRPFIRVTDNGLGLPQENRHRLAEPYMTTREKGTGLGLAIVKRIMEEHGGRLMFADSASGLGAEVTLEFGPLENHEILNKIEPSNEFVWTK